MTSKAEVEQAVKRVLRQHGADRPTMSANEIAAHLPEAMRGRVTVFNALATLGRRGEVERTTPDKLGRCRYSLAVGAGAAAASAPAAPTSTPAPVRDPAAVLAERIDAHRAGLLRHSERYSLAEWATALDVTVEAVSAAGKRFDCCFLAALPVDPHSRRHRKRVAELRELLGRAAA
jgi:hypothetical protein